MSFYPDSLDVRPLTTWPGELTPAYKRTRSPFSATLGTTLNVLGRELSHIGCTHGVMEVAMTADDFRNDGRPRATARATHPGVVLSLPKTNVGPLRYATDLFFTWQDNLRAIALGMDALRRVDRYGITRRGEQYAGFKALPPGSGAASQGGMTADDAAALIAAAASWGPWSFTATDVLRDSAVRRDAFRHAAKKAHPDAGGDRAFWDSLDQANRVLAAA